MTEPTINIDALLTTKAGLEKKGYTAHIFSTLDEIHAFLNKATSPTDIIGLGGSQTIRHFEVVDFFNQRGNTVYDHWKENLSFGQVLDQTNMHPKSDCFITGLNAITTKGQLINMDFLGNRVVSMIYGPKKVIAIAGYNKIVNTVDEGISRIKNTACPMDSKRLNMGTPCEKAGYCVNCNDSNTNAICKITTIIDSKPLTIDFTIILVPEVLGY